MKLQDFSLEKYEQELIDFAEAVKVILNYGKYSSQIITQPPWWKGREGESVYSYVLNSDGSHSFFTYYWLGSSWIYTKYLSSVTSLFYSTSTAVPIWTPVLDPIVAISDRSVTSIKIALEAVNSGHIATQSILAQHLTTGELITLSAQIKDAIITNAKIGDLAVNKLTAGTMAAVTMVVSTAGDLRSENWSEANSAGFKMHGSSGLTIFSGLIRGKSIENYSVNYEKLSQQAWMKQMFGHDASNLMTCLFHRNSDEIFNNPGGGGSAWRQFGQIVPLYRTSAVTSITIEIEFSQFESIGSSMLCLGAESAPIWAIYSGTISQRETSHTFNFTQATTGWMDLKLYFINVAGGGNFYIYWSRAYLGIDTSNTSSSNFYEMSVSSGNAYCIHGIGNTNYLVIGAAASTKANNYFSNYGDSIIKYIPTA